MDREWIRSTVEKQINAIYMFKDPSGGDVEKMVTARFSGSPILQFPGFKELHPLFDFKQWLKDLFSIWSLNSFNFTNIYAEGNAADYAMHELHYYANPDGSKRYLDVYIVQSVMVDENGKLSLFKSYNDSAWLDETFFASEIYKGHYGYPRDYPPRK